MSHQLQRAWMAANQPAPRFASGLQLFRFARPDGGRAWDVQRWLRRQLLRRRELRRAGDLGSDPPSVLRKARLRRGVRRPGQGALAAPRFIVNPQAESRWALPDYELRTSPVSGAATLVIYRNIDDTSPGGGRDQFVQLLGQAEATVERVVDNGFVGVGSYTMVPRNAVLVIVFDDLIDPDSVHVDSVRVLVGEPTIQPFEARVFLDPNHGALADHDGQPGEEFYSTRLIVDPSVSASESLQSSPPLEPNTVGLPGVQFASLAWAQSPRVGDMITMGELVAEVTAEGQGLSGLGANFDGNLLSGIEDPQEIVHPRAAGDTLRPGDLSTAADGKSIIPLPLNRGVPALQRRYDTWRDTSLDTRGGANGPGGPPPVAAAAAGAGGFLPFVDPMGNIDCTLPGDPNPVYFPEEVRTAALPLLVDILAFASNGSSTANVFAQNFATAGQLPGFRAYSSGGRTQSGELVIVDPSAETSATGGFDPTSNPPGAPIAGVDSTVYLGALDLVVRVSRVSSVFFPAADPRSAGPSMGPAAGGVSKYVGEFPAPMTPASEGLVNGGSCFDASFNYRVADENADGAARVTFLGSDGWRRSIGEIDSARFFQVRLSFQSNPASGEAPELSSIGFAWVHP